MAASPPSSRPPVSTSDASELLSGVGLSPAGHYPWGEQVQLDQPGVYVVATDGRYTVDEVPLDDPLIDMLLRVRPELCVDGHRPTQRELRERLTRMWLPGTTIVYIGLASRSVRHRINQYYRTPLGARAPHAGGWPIKLLKVLDRCTVHVAATANFDDAERALVRALQRTVQVPAGYVDVGCVLPYANLTVPGGRSQHHGISGARAPR